MPASQKRRRLVQPRGSSDEDASAKSGRKSHDSSGGAGSGAAEGSSTSSSGDGSDEDGPGTNVTGSEEDESSSEEGEGSSDSDESEEVDEAGEEDEEAKVDDKKRARRRLKREELRKTHTNKATLQEDERTDIIVQEGRRFEPKPMVELKAGSNIWYQAYVIKESANEVKIEVPVSSGAKRKPLVEWLRKTSSRIWRGSLKVEHWRHLGKGSWEPKVAGPVSGKRARGASSGGKRVRGNQNRSAQRSGASAGCSTEHNSRPAGCEDEVMSPRPSNARPASKAPRAVITAATTAEASTGDAATGSVGGGAGGGMLQGHTSIGLPASSTGPGGGVAGLPGRNGGGAGHKRAKVADRLAELSDHEHASTHSPLPAESQGACADQSSARANSSLEDAAVGEVAPFMPAAPHQGQEQLAGTASAGKDAHCPEGGAQADPLTRWFLRHITALASAGMLGLVPGGSLEAGALPPGFAFDATSHSVVLQHPGAPMGLSSTQAGSRQASPAGLASAAAAAAAAAAHPAASNASRHAPRDMQTGGGAGGGAAAAAGQSASSPNQVPATATPRGVPMGNTKGVAGRAAPQGMSKAPKHPTAAQQDTAAAHQLGSGRPPSKHAPAVKGEAQAGKTVADGKAGASDGPAPMAQAANKAIATVKRLNSKESSTQAKQPAVDAGKANSTTAPAASSKPQSDAPAGLVRKPSKPQADGSGPGGKLDSSKLSQGSKAQSDGPSKPSQRQSDKSAVIPSGKGGKLPPAALASKPSKPQPDGAGQASKPEPSKAAQPSRPQADGAGKPSKPQVDGAVKGSQQHADKPALTAKLAKPPADGSAPASKSHADKPAAAGKQDADKTTPLSGKPSKPQADGPDKQNAKVEAAGGVGTVKQTHGSEDRAADMREATAPSGKSPGEGSAGQQNHRGSGSGSAGEVGKASPPGTAAWRSQANTPANPNAQSPSENAHQVLHPTPAAPSATRAFLPPPPPLPQAEANTGNLEEVGSTDPLPTQNHFSLPPHLQKHMAASLHVPSAGNGDAQRLPPPPPPPPPRHSPPRQPTPEPAKRPPSGNHNYTDSKPEPSALPRAGNSTHNAPKPTSSSGGHRRSGGGADASEPPARSREGSRDRDRSSAGAPAQGGKGSGAGPGGDAKQQQPRQSPPPRRNVIMAEDS